MKTTPRRHIRMIVYNIVSAGGNNLNAALWAMNHMHIDLGFLLETKLFHDKYTKNCEGCTVYSTRKYWRFTSHSGVLEQAQFVPVRHW